MTLKKHKGIFDFMIAKKILATALAAGLSLSTVVNVNAKQNLNQKELSSISQSLDLLENNSKMLCADYKGGDDLYGFNIKRWKDANHYVIGEFVYTDRDVVGRDERLISVAKGQTLKLGANVRVDDYASLSINEFSSREGFDSESESNQSQDGDNYNSNNKYNYNLFYEDFNTYFYESHSMTYEFTAETKFIGPSESSEFNSREYRIRFLRDIGVAKFELHEIDEYGNDNVVDTLEEDFVKPCKFLIYSIDRLIV